MFCDTIIMDILHNKLFVKESIDENKKIYIAVDCELVAFKLVRYSTG